MVIISCPQNVGKYVPFFYWMVGKQQWYLCVSTPALHLMVKITSNTSRVVCKQCQQTIFSAAFVIAPRGDLNAKFGRVSRMVPVSSHNTLKIILIESPWKKFWYLHLKSVLIVISTRKWWRYLPWMEINRPWIIKIWKKIPTKTLVLLAEAEFLRNKSCF